MDSLINVVLKQGRIPRWKAWGVTVLFVFVSFLVRLAIDPIYPYPFLTFIPAVFLAAFLFNRHSSFVATGLSAVLTFVFFMEPRLGLQMPDSGQLLGLLLFVGVCATVGVLTERLRSALEENVRLRDRTETLLQELNHRIFGDLSQVYAMVTNEVRHGGGRRLRAVADRILVLGRIYRLMRSDEDGAVVPMQPFLTGLADELRGTYVDDQPIGIGLAVEPLDLPIEPATGIGLIMNELVVNAFRHAFPDRAPGRVSVALRRTDRVVVLSVSDNGVGMDPATVGRGSGFGHLLVQQVVQQLGGRLDVRSDPGTTLTVTLPADAGSPTYDPATRGSP